MGCFFPIVISDHTHNTIMLSECFILHVYLWVRQPSYINMIMITTMLCAVKSIT